MNVVFSTPPSPPDTEASIASPAKPGEAYTIPMMASISTPSTAASTSPQSKPTPSAIRRTRTPPRNSDGEIICDHHECEDKPEIIFRRLCEWNKHMDRHERPYKCTEPGCELVPGFTYSGGLLRHQREVHKMHQSMKQPLFCPFPNCNRSSGAGFTRKENLEEHKRRRHLDEVSQTTAVTPSLSIALPAQQISHDPYARKRKRLATPHSAADNDDDNSVGPEDADSPKREDHLAIIKRLRTENQQQRDIIFRQGQELQHLQHQFHRLQSLMASLPHQALYSVNGSMLSNTMASQTMSMTYSNAQDHSHDTGGAG